MEFINDILWFIAQAEPAAKKSMPAFPHLYAIPILFLIGIGIGYWYRGRKVGH